jgi:hypothetical protein
MMMRTILLEREGPRKVRQLSYYQRLADHVDHSDQEEDEEAEVDTTTARPDALGDRKSATAFRLL